MKTSITFEQFCKSIYSEFPNCFTEEGLKLLFERLEEHELIQVIDVGLKYAESSFNEFASDYSVDADCNAIESKILDNSYLVGFTKFNTVVYQDF